MSIAVLILSLFNLLKADLIQADDVIPRGANAYQMVTGDDSEGDRHHWDRIYNIKGYVYGKEPIHFLKESSRFLHSLQGGRALDLATGEGRNAVFLAKKGFVVEGVDISEVALRKAKRLARENRVSISTIIADLANYQVKADTYQLILNLDYLQRNLIPQIKRGLKHHGIVIFENPTVDQISSQSGAYIRRDLLLNHGELKEMFKDFEILYYRESNDPKEARASLIARKP